jgi:DNA-binding response OmpR family regulator
MFLLPRPGPDDRSTGLIRGADGYLVDPIERDELLVTVIALLRYHYARRASEPLAARLEQLHQTTPLVNAALTVTDLTRFASPGARRSPPHGANWSARSCS